MTVVRPRFRANFRPPVRALIVTLTLVVGALLVRGSWADLEAPTSSDRQIAVAVASLLNHEHVSKHPLNEEMSRRWMTMFLKSLDPMKLYFLQSDIDRFEKHRDELGERLERGDIGFAYEVFKVYIQRLNERVAVIDELLKMNHDFTVDETMNVDFDKRPYAANADELRERWRKRIKYDLLELKAEKLDKARQMDKSGGTDETDGAEGPEAREKLARRYHSFARNMKQFDHDDLLETYLTSLTTCYDPHTSYMSPSTLENFEIMMRGELQGIGAALQMVDGSTVVSKVVPGGAAQKDGRLKAKDQIIGVGQGESGPIVSVVDMRLNDVVQLVRGPRNTWVRLQVLPGGSGKPKVYNITRASIELTDSLARSEIITSGSRPDGTPYKIGVIDLPSFYMDMAAAREDKKDYRSTTRDVKRLLADFRTKGVDVVMLDLRRNGGGALTEAISLTGLFIDEGPMVQVKDADGQVHQYNDPVAGTDWDGPLVVLTSKFSASASEILAGAIQDYHRGLIVGDHTTHGKGTVQSMINLGQQLFRSGDSAPKWGALKITMQQFYRPDGDSTQNRGVLADVEVPSLTSHLDVGETDLEYALKFDKVNSATFTSVNMVDPQLAADLSRRSAQRCAASDDFKKVAKRIERYRHYKDRKTVSLNEKKYLAERSGFSAEDDEEKELEKQETTGRPVVERNAYFNETLAITLDYLQALNKAKLAKGQ